MTSEAHCPIVVSVIIPVFGRQDMLSPAIESCFVSAGSMPVEVIVVDDASPVPVRYVGARTNVSLDRLDRNQGSSHARNVGISKARGRYLKFLDSDDLLAPRSLLTEVEIADANDADIVVSGWRNTTLLEDGSEAVESIYHAPQFGSILDDLLAGRAVPTSAALYRTLAIGSARWDPGLSKLNDWGFFIDAALNARSIVRNPGVAYDWRSHPGERITTSSSIEKGVSDFYAILDGLITSIDRRGELTVARKRRAAQYLYKELRRLYRFDASQARQRLRHIRELDRSFTPIDEERSRIFRLLGRLGLLSPALELYGAMRRTRPRDGTR